MANDNPVNVETKDEIVQGQPQADKAPEQQPFDGKVRVRETSITTDVVIKDPNAPEAVQVPEGVGASSVDRPNPLAETLEGGTAEEQFAAGSKDEKKSSSAPSKS